MINLTFLLSADPNITDVLERKRPQIIAATAVGYGKWSIFDILTAASLKRCKAWSKLLLAT